MLSPYLQPLADELHNRGRVQFYVHARPGAPLTRVVGGQTDGSVKITIAAPPAEGKANAALVRFLADQFGVPKQSVMIVSGLMSRLKLVRVSHDQND
jgi:uncharacterized protein